MALDEFWRRKAATVGERPLGWVAPGTATGREGGMQTIQGRRERGAVRVFGRHDACEARMRSVVACAREVCL